MESESNNSNAEIEEPEGDEFFNVAKKNVIKKLELEVLKDELDSANYQKSYPDIDNIYYEIHEDVLSFDEDPFKKHESPEDIVLKIERKKNEIIQTQEEYKKSALGNDSHSNIILYNDTLDLYIKNKEKLTSIIKKIDSEVQKGIPISDILNGMESTEEPNQQTTDRIKFNKLKSDWEPKFKDYEKINNNIRDLFNQIYDDSLLNENDKLYKKLRDLKLFNTNGLFNKAIYDSNELKSLIDRLRDNFFVILKDYSGYNEYAKSILYPSNAPGKNVIYTYRKESSELQKKILRLETELSQIKRSQSLPSSRKRRDSLIKLKQLRENDKQRLTDKIRSLQEEKEAEIRKLNEKIEELKSRKSTEESKDTQSHDIEELNRRTEELIEILDKKISELSRLQKLVNSPEELDSEIQILESQDTGFLRLVIDAADLYGKPEFKDSFNKLLDYRPDNKFMFSDVFAKMEQDQGNKELDNFLQKLDKIPEDLFKHQLISDITKKITIPIPQTR